MGRDITEHIDEYVEDNYGHTNWGYKSSYTKEELADTSKYELEINDSIVIWYEEHNPETCDECEEE